MAVEPTQGGPRPCEHPLGPHQVPARALRRRGGRCRWLGDGGWIRYRWGVESETAELGLHARGRLAFAAASAAGLPGEFRAVKSAALLALITTSPALSFLCSVTGVREDSVEELAELLETYAALDTPSPSLITSNPNAKLREQLRLLGFTPADRRPLATIDLPAASIADKGDGGGLHVAEVEEGGGELGLFLDVLAAGYAAPTDVSNFLRVEHSAPGVRRFLAWQGNQPIAAGALSVHGGVAVLGGAATVPAARGLGAQAVLLQHRLRMAESAGCVAATATAAPDSPSTRNLARAGFTVVLRHGWRRRA